jgi:nitrogen regulatory protein PII
MKEIKAIIKHERLEPVRQALDALGISGMTITEVKGFGHQRGYTETYRGARTTVHFRPKIELVTVINDELKDTVVDAIIKNAGTESIGDGKIFVSNVEEVARIRTGEVGVGAL